MAALPLGHAGAKCVAACLRPSSAIPHCPSCRLSPRVSRLRSPCPFAYYLPAGMRPVDTACWRHPHSAAAACRAPLPRPLLPRSVNSYQLGSQNDFTPQGNRWDLTGGNTQYPAGVGTSQVPSIFQWAKIILRARWMTSSHYGTFASTCSSVPSKRKALPLCTAAV